MVTLITEFILFLYQLDTLNFLFTSTILGFLYMFRTDQSIIRRIKCLITQAAFSVPEVTCVIKHLILLMMDRSVRNM
jgi:hypothetical protein